MESIERAVLDLAHTLPLELFAFIASFLEEVIPPIPSPSVVILAGSLAEVQGYTFILLVGLVLAASLGKTLGAFLVYTLVKHAGIEVIDRFGSFLHIHHSDIVRYGSKITGTPRDYLVLSTLRGIPIIPSIVLSFGSGVLRVPPHVFVVGTFIGTLIRDSIYVAIGYTGISVFRQWAEHGSAIETTITLIAAVLVSVIFTITWKKRHKKKQGE